MQRISDIYCIIKIQSDSWTISFKYWENTVFAWCCLTSNFSPRETTNDAASLIVYYNETSSHWDRANVLPGRVESDISDICQIYTTVQWVRKQSSVSSSSILSPMRFFLWLVRFSQNQWPFNGLQTAKVKRHKKLLYHTGFANMGPERQPSGNRVAGCCSLQCSYSIQTLQRHQIKQSFTFFLVCSHQSSSIYFSLEIIWAGTIKARGSLCLLCITGW